jgi:hypothetical protein
MHKDIIEHTAREAGYAQGYDQGYKDGNDGCSILINPLVLELMDEVIEAYNEMPVSNQEQADHKQVQTNAVRFMKSWVMSGGQEDFDGNRMCLPW